LVVARLGTAVGSTVGAVDVPGTPAAAASGLVAGMGPGEESLVNDQVPLATSIATTPAPSSSDSATRAITVPRPPRRGGSV